MIFEVICLIGLIFVVVTLPGALRRRDHGAKRILPVINDTVSTESTHKNSDSSPLARDRQEVLELWERCSNETDLPAPIPPAKPHPYFGGEIE